MLFFSSDTLACKHKLVFLGHGQVFLHHLQLRLDVLQRLLDSIQLLPALLLGQVQMLLQGLHFFLLIHLPLEVFHLLVSCGLSAPLLVQEFCSS